MAFPVWGDGGRQDAGGYTTEPARAISAREHSRRVPAGFQPAPLPVTCDQRRFAEVRSRRDDGSAGRIIDETRHRLPHWTTDHGTYFVTFRLADALPPALAWKIRRRHDVADDILDRCYGKCWLRDHRVAEIVDAAIRHFDEERYLLHAWTLMPNHVHITFRALAGFTRASITHSWKSFTASRVNQLLGTTGTVWQREGFDSLLHDQNDLDRVIDYIVRNPIKARLTNWPWTAVLRTDFAF